VREAVVIGERREYLTALVGIEADTVTNWATRQRVPFTTYADLAARPEVRALIDGWVQTVNSDLAQVETVKDFRLLPKELDHGDGALTATQTVKRRALDAEFAALIEEMYASS
jgi:long-chain acyl-CoA synthetase